jgi:hypothetical protein
MSNYTKSTNFATKDALPSGDALKIVKGTEIDTEFNNIATAVATKADLASPTFTGTPALPTGTTAVTQSAGNNTTALATTAFVTAGLQALYPVGSIYINAGVTTNPATLLGFGTWTAFGAGRVMVGLDGSDALFDALEETGGSKDATLVSHNHTGTTASNGAHQHLTVYNALTDDPSQYSPTVFSNKSIAGMGGANGFEFYTLNGASSAANGGLTTSAGAHDHSFTTSTQGSSATDANLQPYITVAMWKRTA